MSQRCVVHEPNKGQCRATKDVTLILTKTPIGGMVVIPHSIVIALCPRHYQEARARADETAKETP